MRGNLRRSVTLVALAAALGGAVAVTSQALGGTGAQAGGTRQVASEFERELVALRDARSKTFELSDGSRVTKVYSEPVHFRDAGTWRTVDNRLARTADAYRNGANSFDVRLPERLDAPVKVTSGTASMSFQLRGASAPAEVRGSTARYTSALEGVNVDYGVHGGALKETLTLTRTDAPMRFVFDLDLSAGLRARENTAGGIDLVRRGRVAFAFAPPWMRDATGAMSRAVKLRLGRGTVSLAANRDWITAPSRRLPIVIDPTLTIIPDACYVASGSVANTSFCGDPALKVGSDASRAYHTLVRIPVSPSIPRTADVLSATLALNLRGATGTGSMWMDAHAVTRAWTAQVTWNRHDGAGAWSTPGGDHSAVVAATAQYVAGTGQAVAQWHPTQLVQAMVNGSVANHGLLIKPRQASGLVVSFDSLHASGESWPYLTVHWEPGAGDLPRYTFDRWQLTDRSEAAVNVANGNLLLREQDIRHEGSPFDYAVTRTYNNLVRGAGEPGDGWTVDAGHGGLRTLNDGTVAFAGPSGYWVGFRPRGDGSFESPPGVDQILTRNPDGTYLLDMWEEGRKIEFDQHGFPRRLIDQYGRTIAFRYDDPNNRLTSMSDSAGRSYALAYSGQTLTSLSEPAGTHTYAPTGSGTIRSHTDAAGRRTTYTYDVDRNLIRIDDASGGRTKIAYDAERRVTAFTRVTDFAADTGPTTRYTYHADRTGVTAPDGRQTTHWHEPSRFVPRSQTGSGPPALAVSGSLWDDRDTTLVGGQGYTLTGSATDADGVASIDIAVDGDSEDTAEQDCAGCPLSLTATLEANDYPAGEHIVSVTAVDRAGNQTVERFRFSTGGSAWTVPESEETADLLDGDDMSATSDDAPVPDPWPRGSSLAASSALPAARSSKQGTESLLGPPEVSDDFNRDGVQPTGTPPDPTGSVSDRFYVHMLNFRVRVFDRETGQLESGASLSGFMTPRQSANEQARFVYDPQVVWDDYFKRWFYAAAVQDRNANGQVVGDRNRIAFGWSRSQNPTDLTRANWCKYLSPPRSDADGAVRQDDYPKLAVSRRHLIIGANVFQDDVLRFSRLRVVPKPRRGATACPDGAPRVFTFGPLRARDANDPGTTYPAFTPVPVQAGSNAFNGWVIASDAAHQGFAPAQRNLTVWRVAGRRSRPRLRDATGTGFAVPEYAAPAPVPQNASIPLDTFEGRLTQAVGDTDPGSGRFTIWIQHAISAGDAPRRSLIRWYQVNPSRPATPGPRAPEQTGTIDVPALWAFQGAIAPARNGSDVILHYNVAGPQLAPEIRASSRTAETPPNQMTGQLVLVRSPATLDGADCGARPRRDGVEGDVCRWGDYAAASPDPERPNGVWGAGMHVGDDRNYHTRVFSLRTTPGP